MSTKIEINIDPYLSEDLRQFANYCFLTLDQAAEYALRSKLLEWKRSQEAKLKE